MTRSAQMVCVVNMFPSDVLAVEEQAVSEPRLDISQNLVLQTKLDRMEGWGHLGS